MIHVHDKPGNYVASINKQDKLAPGYQAHEPWLLLYRTGRVERFPSCSDARGEAAKTWPACKFKRS